MATLLPASPPLGIWDACLPLEPLRAWEDFHLPAITHSGGRRDLGHRPHTPPRPLPALLPSHLTSPNHYLPIP